MVKFEIDTCWIKRILLASVGRVLHPLREYGAIAWKSNGGAYAVDARVLNNLSRSLVIPPHIILFFLATLIRVDCRV